MTELITKKEIGLDNFKTVFPQITEELEEHLAAINENTAEIQENYTSTCELDNKIAKLNTRIDEIYNLLSNLTGKKIRKMPAFEDIDPLTDKEKIVFLHLYKQVTPIHYEQLASSLSVSIDLARQYVLNLMEKGIPIQKTYKNTRSCILLDPKFKNLQAKKNILKIEQKILM